MGQQLVQLVLGGATLVCVGIALIFFVKLVREKEGKRNLVKFFIIELLIFIATMLIMRIALGPVENISVFIIISLIYTVLANIPIGIIAGIISKIIGIFLKSKSSHK